MLDSKYYEDVFHVTPRNARRAAAYALSYIARGKPYDPVVCAVDAVLQGGAQWTTRATWKMAKMAMRREHWIKIKRIKTVDEGWWCRCSMKGMLFYCSVFVDAALRIHEHGPIAEQGRLI